MRNHRCPPGGSYHRPRHAIATTLPFPIDPRYLDAAEAQFGVQLPPAYRARLQHKNGGEIELDGEPWFLHPVRDDSDPKRLARSWDDIVHQTTAARRWRDFPPAGISIAGDGGGNRLVLLPTHGGMQLAIWDHETGSTTPSTASLEELFAAQ